MGNIGKVLIAAPVHHVLMDALVTKGFECIVAEQITQARAFELIKDCVGVITSTRIQLDKDLLDAAPKLQWIGRMGSGMEVIDMDYARKKGIICFFSPEGNCNAVGEHAMGMLLSVIRRISWSHNELKENIWKREENRGTELEGKTVGIIGYGHTGAAFAKKLIGFDVRVIAYDKYLTNAIPRHIMRANSLDILMREADILSFHVPLQADTIHYFNNEFLDGMQKQFLLINTSRGQVVDMQVVYNGLISGKIVGACLDVFEQEPITGMIPNILNIFNEIKMMENVVVTPHIAGYTFEALYKMSKVLAEKLGAP